MKKHLILIASALILAGCSAPAAVPAAPSASSATASGDTAFESPAAVAGSPASTSGAVAAGKRMSNEETCAEIKLFLAPHTLPGGGNEAERDAMEVTMRTLPDRASEDLKEAAPALSKFAEVAFTDARNNTRELDNYLADQAVLEAYQKSQAVISDICGLATSN